MCRNMEAEWGARSHTGSGVGNLELAGFEWKVPGREGLGGRGVLGRRTESARCAAGRRPDGWGARCPRAGGRWRSRCGAATPPHPGPGAGPGGASGALAPCQFGCSDLLWPPRPRPETCGLPSPRPPVPHAAAARRAPPAAPAPCPPAAWAPPPNPRGGRRRCCLYCFSASSGLRETDQEPVSTQRPAPHFPPGRRACALGAAAGGGGREGSAGATWTAREQRKAPPARPSGRPHLRGAQRSTPLARGSNFRARGLTWAAGPRTSGPDPDTLPGPPEFGGPAYWDPLHAGTRRAHATASADSEPWRPRGTDPGRGRTRKMRWVPAPSTPLPPPVEG